MTEYTSAINLAARLIIKKGRLVTHRHLTTDAVPDAQRPWDKAAPLKADQQMKVVVLAYSANLIDGTTIMAKDRQILMFAKGLNNEPTVKDLIWDQGAWWEVKAVEDIRPGDEAVLFILQVRK